MKKLSVLFAIILVLSLCAACGGNPAPTAAPENTSEPTTAAPAPADLTGQWTQVDAGGRFQGAMIGQNAIRLFWISNGGNTVLQSWEGSFAAPTTADEPYTWESKAAEGDKTIVFTYENQQITFTEPEVGSTITLKKGEWAPGKGIEDDVTTPPETLPPAGDNEQPSFGSDGEVFGDDPGFYDEPDDDYRGDTGDEVGGVEDNGGAGIVEPDDNQHVDTGDDPSVDEGAGGSDIVHEDGVDLA